MFEEIIVRMKKKMLSQLMFFQIRIFCLFGQAF